MVNENHFQYHEPRRDLRWGKTEHFSCSAVIAQIPAPVPLFLMLRKLLLLSVALCLASSDSAAASKLHVISFGKWISAKWPNATGQKLLDLKVRPLFVDTRLKEYTTGSPHELTDRLFAVRRAFRVNDSLPTETCQRRALAMAAWRLAAGRPPDRTSLPTQPARVRSLLLHRKLVSRLHRLLRSLGRRQKTLCRSSPGRTPQAHLEKRSRRTRRGRRSRLGVPASRLGAYPHASHLSARQRSEAGVFHPRPRGRCGQRRRRTRRVAAALHRLAAFHGWLTC